MVPVPVPVLIKIDKFQETVLKTVNNHFKHKDLTAL
jgi:hypothetical protein